MTKPPAVSKSHVLFIGVYSLCFSLSVLTFGFAITVRHYSNTAAAHWRHDVFTSVLGMLVSFSSLVLSSVVHRGPVVQPFNTLHGLLHAIMVLFVVEFVWRDCEYLSEHGKGNGMFSIDWALTYM